MKKTLTIDLENDYKLRIESKEELEKSFFKDIYIQAFKQVAGIVKWTNSFKEESDYDFKRENHEYNNILAFVGERGTGKSSAMITVAQALVNNETQALVNDSKSLLNTQTKFESIHTIDPSRFEKDQNVIEVIIAELFEKFQQKIKTEPSRGTESDKREVLKAFQDVYKCLKIISGSNSLNKYDGDALETLATLADATKMEENMRHLIKVYLKYIHSNKAERNSILIIPIDDFDLNVKHAGEMAEQIRKYLMIPQVLVLMAINMDQFGDVKTQEVISDFHVLLSKSKMSESPRDVASRYILKLLPIERRMMIPSIRIERNEVSLELKNGKETIIDLPKGDEKLEKQVFNYIYESTGLYFVSNPEEYHTFLANTLREFRTLCSVIGSFDKLELINDEEADENSKQEKQERNNTKKKKNLERFESYFLNTWIKDYLLTPFQEMIFDSSTILYKNWNKFFITSTVEILSKEKKYLNDWRDNQILDENPRNNFNNPRNTTITTRPSQDSEKNELEYIINRKNYASNVSLGDLIYFLSFLNRVYINDKEIKRLFFSLNCWYSIRLNSLGFDKKFVEIKDIVNGTIVNEKTEIIRVTNTLQNRIQQRFTLRDDYDKSNLFLTYNIFIKHDIRNIRNYRLKENFVNTEILSEKVNNPTFNLFSFVFKDLKNIFPLPYNNLELWHSIIENIDKDYKDKANDFVLVSFLFRQIKDNLAIDMQESFIKHPVVKQFFLDSDSEVIDEKSIIPDWFSEIYRNTPIERNEQINHDKAVVSNCKAIIRHSRKSNINLLNEIISILTNRVNPSKAESFKQSVSGVNPTEIERQKFKNNLISQLDLLLNE